jgi:acyl-ACP thioesterase
MFNNALLKYLTAPQLALIQKKKIGIGGAGGLGSNIATILVRNSDHDFNNHVNNVHYVEWGMEAVDAAWRGDRTVEFLDIAFKAEARAGETIHSEVQILDDHHLLHRMQRVTDRETVAWMRTTWR